MIGVQSGAAHGWLPQPFGNVSKYGKTTTVTVPTPQNWWKFTEGSGTTVADSIGGLNLIAPNGAVWTTVSGKNAVDVSAGNFLYIAGATPQPTTWVGNNIAFTVSFWANFLNSTGGTSGSQSVLTTIGPVNGQEVFCDGAGNIYLFFNGGYPTFATVFGWNGLTNGIHNIVMSVDGTYTTAGTKCYIDGIQQTLLSGLPSPDNYAGSPSPFGGDTQLGFGSRTTGIQTFLGYMTDVRLWNSVLTQPQISRLVFLGPV